MHLIWTAVRKDLLFLAYLVAMPRHLLRDRNAFSTRWRSLYRSSSYDLGVTRFFFGGITAFIPCAVACSRMASVSYPLSAIR